MADRKRVKRSIKQLQRIKTWQLVLLAILALLIAATFLRLNNIGMIQRRTAVLNADKAGDANVTQARLYDLQRYTASHMNADTGGVYLEHQYKRDTEKAVKESIGNVPDGNISQKVDKICQQRFPGYSFQYTQCFKAEAEKYPSAPTDDQIKYPNTALYKNEFLSPIWSPDFAGFSLLACAFIILLIGLRLLGLGLLRILLRRHYSSI